MHWFWHISRQLGSFAGAGRQRGRGRFHTCWWSAGPGGLCPGERGSRAPGRGAGRAVGRLQGQHGWGCMRRGPWGSPTSRYGAGQALPPRNGPRSLPKGGCTPAQQGRDEGTAFPLAPAPHVPVTPREPPCRLGGLLPTPGAAPAAGSWGRKPDPGANGPAKPSPWRSGGDEVKP